MPSPKAEAIAKLKAQVEARLNQSHEDRINQLASRLKASLAPSFDKEACAEVPLRPVGTRAAALTDPMNQVRLSEVFDELLASDQANRMQQLNQEVTFRERELQRLREALERAQVEASWSKQKHEATEAQFAKVSNSAALLDTELRRLQHENHTLGQQVQELTSAKAAAERSASTAETRAATAEAVLSSKTQELEQLQAHYKRVLSDQQAEIDRLRQQVQLQALELSRSQSEAATREQSLVKELQAANSTLVDVKTSLAAERSTAEMLHGKVAELSTDMESGRKARQKLQAQLQQVEGLLADSEAEQRSVRAKYMNLGDKLEGMLAEEAKQQKAAASQAADMQQQLHEVQQAALTMQQELSQTTAQLSEAQHALVDADKLHIKAVKKLDKRLLLLTADYNGARQDLLMKSAEILDLQGQVKEMESHHQMQLAAAHDQADALQSQIGQLQQQLQQAAEREQQVRQEAAAAAEDRLELELQQQQLKYERQIQELELQSRYLTALDALANSNSSAARQVLDHAAAASAAGGRDSMGLGLGSEGGVSVDLTGSRSRFDAFDARLRRTLTEHVNRTDAIEAMEARLLLVKKELSADYKRRLDTLEADWASRTAARTAELEGTHALKLQQVELTAGLEKERSQMHIADLTAAKQSLQEQLANAKQEMAELNRGVSQARVRAEEARVGRQLLQTQLEEAERQLKQLQGVVDKYSGGTKGDREVITDLMTRLEARTTERHEALQAAAAAEARLKVLESEKMPLQQRQMQQALDTAEAARAAAEGKLKAALAEAAEAAAAAEASQSASARQLKRLQEERQKLEASLEEVTSARSSLERQLNLSQAEGRSLASRLKETSQALSLLQEDYTAQEAVIVRLKDEKQQLLANNSDLESVRAQLSSDVIKSSEEQRRLSLMVQGLEASKAGLQRRLSVVAAEKQSAVRTSELRASTPSPTRASIVSGMLGPDLRTTITTLPPTLAAGADSSALLRDNFTVAAVPGGAGEDSGGSSPMARHSTGSFAFSVRPGFRALESVVAGGIPAAQAQYCNMQDLEGLLSQFDEERRLMLQRYDALDAENSSLRQQLAAATVRASELSMNNEQLLKSLERHKGALEMESKAAHELADKVLSDVQRSSNDMAQLNSWLQSELDAARRGHKDALEAASTAEKKAIMLEAKASELQRAAAVAAKEAEENHNTQLSKLEVSSSMQISSMKSKLAVMKDDVKMQLAALAKGGAQKIADLGERHAKELQQQKDGAAAAVEVVAAEHSKQTAQLQQQLKDQEDSAAVQITELHQQLDTLQDRMAAVVRLLLAALQSPQQQQQEQQQLQQQLGSTPMGGLMQQYAGPVHRMQQQPVTPGRASITPGRATMMGPASPSRLSISPPGRASMSPSAGGFMQQLPQQYQQQQQPGYGNSNGHRPGMYVDQLQHDQSAASAALGPLPHEALELSATLSNTVMTDSGAEPAAEEVAGALQVLVQGLCEQLQLLNQQLNDAQQENDQLVMDASTLASDLQMCATNLQSLVATVAFTIPVDEEVQQGLNAKDAAVFDEQLAALHEAIKNHVESEKQQLSATLHAGPIADLQQQLEAAHAALAEATGTIKQMKTERQEEITRFENGLHRARNEAADGAELARKESLGGLKAELQQMKAQLAQLQDAHSSELGSVQEASARQLAAHVKSADAIIKELESTANNLQTQLALEVERADAYSKELKRLHDDKQRQLQLGARKDRRATGEIEGLRERLRAMESREKEKEDEMKQLRRSLRQKELSLLSSGATSIVDK